jgi:SAM-dependent methyltransferase
VASQLQCDFCESHNMEHVYDPINSTRGMRVYVCRQCGLVQSISTSAYTSAPPGSMSGDANRSSYRYTKELVFGNYLPLFERYLDFNAFRDVLDIGSNRGIFVDWALTHYPHLHIHAIEPQESVVQSYRDHANVNLEIARFEDVRLKESTYDFVYCVHTLEHSLSASQMVRESYRALKPGGLFFLAVPQTLLFHDDLIEEIFIDPHTFHFDLSIVSEFARQLGFKTVYSTEEKDAEVILILEKVHAGEGKFVPVNGGAATRNIAKIASYRDTIHANRALLKKIGDRLNDLSNTNALIVWGAGRIFDILVREGKVDTSRIKVVFDKVLYKFIDQAHGCAISQPRPRSDFEEPGVVVFIASREYSAEIKEDAKKLGYDNMISFADFF